jgi:nicotinate-nucleotide adenylyltransferase
MMRAMRGGTFDPIHWGHLRPAQQVQKLIQADQLLLMPSAQPPHRGYPGATAKQRLDMAVQAATELENCQAEAWELHQHRPSYSAQTLAELKQRWPQDHLVFLLGEDAFAGLNRWYQWQRLFDHAHFVIMRRPHSQYQFCDELQKLLRQREITDPKLLKQRPSGSILMAETEPVDISATAIRHAIAQQLPWQHMVPETVYQYIEAHQLYR